MRFPGTRALDSVTVDFRFDEVHGVIGENGAGKSTLMNVLSGSLAPTSGRISIEDRELKLSSPRQALSCGIAYVSQEGSLVPGLNGAENILLGAEPKLARGVIDTAALHRRARELTTDWFPQVEIDLRQPVGSLPMADQKVVEIIRALRANMRLLILDEPTASLPSREKERLWDIIRSLPKRGIGVVLISHFLSEVKGLSDRITVLRDGQHVGTLAAAEVTEQQLVDLMLRRTGDTPQARAFEAGNGALGDTVLSAKDWHVGNVVGPSFEMRAGEIVGLIGLTGAGHFEFARSLYTRSGVVRGHCEVGGRTVTSRSARAMQRQGIAFIPDRRMENALIGEWDLRENLAMVHPEHAAMGRSGILKRRTEAVEADRIKKLLNVKASSQYQLLKNLSGGNKQKVSIGKWLYGARERYRLMIFVQPTEGVDIGAKLEIHAHMRRLAERGVAILIASSDLLEVEIVANRAVAFVDGRPVEEIPRERFSESAFISAISGSRQ